MLDDLQKFEALLLLHLAGELPPDQSAKLDQQLAADPVLRQSLDELRHLNEGLTLVIRQCDDFAVGALTRDSRRHSTMRQISRAMVRRQLQERAAPAGAPGEGIRHLRLRTWSFSVAASLAIVGLAVLYLSSLTTGQPGKPQISDSTPGYSANHFFPAPMTDVVSQEDEELLGDSSGSYNYDVSSIFGTQTD